jgi:hypothetical protein
VLGYQCRYQRPPRAFLSLVLDLNGRIDFLYFLSYIIQVIRKRRLNNYGMKITGRENMSINYYGTLFKYQRYILDDKIEIIKPLTRNFYKCESSEKFFIYKFYEKSIIINEKFKVKKVNEDYIGFSIYHIKTNDNQKIKVYFDTSKSLGLFYF